MAVAVLTIRERWSREITRIDYQSSSSASVQAKILMQNVCSGWRSNYIKRDNDVSYVNATLCDPFAVFPHSISRNAQYDYSQWET